MRNGAPWGGAPQGELELGVTVRVSNDHSGALSTYSIDFSLTSYLTMLRELAELHARLEAGGWFDLHEAVDFLQLLAEQLGLIELVGQDAIQAIIAKPFGTSRLAVSQ